MRITRLELVEGAIIPRYYGLSYRDYMTHTIICHPMPFHLIGGWFRRLFHFYMKHFKIPKYVPTYIDRVIIEAREKESKRSELRLAFELAQKDRAWMALIDKEVKRRLGEPD